MSAPEDLLAFQLRAAGLAGWQREYRFSPPRRWRMDFAWPEQKLAVEIDGGGWVGGRHSRGAGIEADSEKYSAAAVLGYRVIRVTPRQVRTGEALRWIEQALGGAR